MSLRHALLRLVVIAACTAAAARAEPLLDDQPSSQPTVNTVLKELTERYGAAAVSLQGYLLEHSIRAGSQLEITVTIAGMESRDGREYLAYVLDTGIVYQAAEVSPRAQLSRIWTDVVDPSVRKAAHSSLPGAGVALRLRSYRGQFADRAAAAREHAAQRLQPVDTSFTLPHETMRAFADGKITASDVSTRGVVELDGVATRLEIIPTPVPTAEPTLVP